MIKNFIKGLVAKWNAEELQQKANLENIETEKKVRRIQNLIDLNDKLKLVEESLVESFKRYHPQPFDTDTAVVLDIYNLNKGANGWDDGANLVYGMIYDRNGNNNPGPIFPKLTKIYVDTSYFNNVVDKWLNDISYEAIEKYAGYTIDMLSGFIAEYTSKRQSNLPEGAASCMFWSAKFSIEGLNPEWGICINSFIPLNEKRGEETKSIWEEEAVIDAEIKLNHEKIAKLELVKKINTRHSKYQGGKRKK